MEHTKDDSIFFLSAGPLAAILLGCALIPLRGLTSASNLSFAFMALTILIAEYGGRNAALATALCSALSLDFFLTRPYLRLTIMDKHDLIAFLGLGTCGLIAAALGSQRGERIASLREARKELDLLHEAIGGLEDGEPLVSRLGHILDGVRSACPITAAVIRDEHDRILAASYDVHAELGVPAAILSPRTLLPRGAADDPRLPFPTDGARLALVVGNQQRGWLDIWGSGARANAQGRRSLADTVRVVARLLPEAGRA